MTRTEIEAIQRELANVISYLRRLDAVLRQAADHVAEVSDQLQDLHQRTLARRPPDQE